MNKPSQKEITTPLTTKTSQIYALEGSFPTSHAQLYEALKQAGYSVVVLRPPTLWEPLAPLRHLCEHWQQPYPEWESVDTEPATFWLGIQSIWSRFFLRVTELLRDCPTIAWIEAEDLKTPVWGEFLRLAQQKQLKIPVSFVYARQPNALAEFGIRHLKLSESQKTPSPHLFAPDLPKRATQYLRQAIFFGDTVDLSVMLSISRAKHKQRLGELQALGLIDERANIQPERLRFAKLEPPPTSDGWRKKALRQLQRLDQDKTPKAIWLRQNKEPQLSTRQPLSSEEVGTSILALGPTFLQHLATHMPSHQITEDAYISVYLALSRIPESALPTPPVFPSQPGLASLLKARSIGQQSQGRIETLNECHRQLVSTGPQWAAALVATELAHWNLSLGRIQFVFSLLKPYGDSPNWAIRWLQNTLFAKAFARMGRFGLAHNSLEQAVAVSPKPISPVLAAELRLLSTTHRSSDETSTEVQDKEARDVFRAAGDGVRLGYFLLAAAEFPWKRNQWIDARNLLVRALDLFRRYRDGLGFQETQLKLGLVIKERPIDVLKHGT